MKGAELVSASYISGSGVLLKMSRKCGVQWGSWESFVLVVNHLLCPEGVLFIHRYEWKRERKDSDFIFDVQDGNVGFFVLELD